MLGKIFQLCYTQVFGIYAGYAYVYTGSFWAAAALHAQCNLLGFPYFSNLFSEEFTITKRMGKFLLMIICNSHRIHLRDWNIHILQYFQLFLEPGSL